MRFYEVKNLFVVWVILKQEQKCVHSVNEIHIAANV